MNPYEDPNQIVIAVTGSGGSAKSRISVMGVEGAQLTLEEAIVRAEERSGEEHGTYLTVAGRVVLPCDLWEQTLRDLAETALSRFTAVNALSANDQAVLAWWEGIVRESPFGALPPSFVTAAQQRQASKT